MSQGAGYSIVSGLAGERVSVLACKPANPQTRKPADRTGSVLIIVLWSVFFLAMLAIAVTSLVRPKLEVSARLLDRAKSYYLARSGVVRAIAEIENDATAGYDSLHDLWSENDTAFKDVSLSGGTFSVIKPADPGQKHGLYGLTDEESKININKAPHEVLKSLLEKEGGLGPMDAGMLADAVLDWRDGDDSLHKDGKEKGYYESLPEPYPCKNGDFETPEELLLVGGMNRRIFDKIKDIVTVYGDGTVNVNTAGKRVLVTLGLSSESADRIIRFREAADSKTADGKPVNVFTDASAVAEVLAGSGGPVSEDAGALARAAALLGVKSDNFRGTARGSLEGEGRSSEIVFVYDRNDGLVKYWREG